MLAFNRFGLRTDHENMYRQHLGSGIPAYIFVESSISYDIFVVNLGFFGFFVSGMAELHNTLENMVIRLQSSAHGKDRANEYGEC